MYTVLKQSNKALSKEMVSFAAELIGTPSVSFEESEIAGKVEKKMLQLGYDKVFIDDFGNVIGIIFGLEREPSLLLNCHMDTVPLRDETWEHAPFKGTVENGRMYGLGAADCKAGLAAQVFAGGILKRSLLPLKGNLVVAATVAEQNGISLGVCGALEHTLPELGLKPAYAVLGEPTGLGLYYGHDGWLEAEVDIQGSNPFHVNDVTRSVYDFVGNGGKAQGSDRIEESLTLGAPQFEDRSGFLRSNFRMAHRLRPSENADEILGRLTREVELVAGEGGGVAVKVGLRTENRRLYNGRACKSDHLVQAWSTDPFHPLVEQSRQALKAAGCQAEPGKWRLSRLMMGTAGNVLSTEFKIPTIGYGPGEEELAHATNEYVELDKLDEAAYGTAAIVHSLIGVPIFGWSSDEI
jgi:acetylornithine deacetylase/succinyl-diaminopimelate desuccinylase-like protein